MCSISSQKFIKKTSWVEEKKMIMMKAPFLEWKMSGKAGRVRLGREPHTEP